MTDLEIIKEAFFALAGSRSPALTKKQQNEELSKCYSLLAERVYRPVGEDDIEDDWSCTSQGEMIPPVIF